VAAATPEVSVGDGDSFCREAVCWIVTRCSSDGYEFCPELFCFCQVHFT
jgi:hypothetical protein